MFCSLKWISVTESMPTFSIGSIEAFLEMHTIVNGVAPLLTQYLLKRYTILLKNHDQNPNL